MRYKAQVFAELFHDFIESRDGVKRPATKIGYVQAMKLYARYLERVYKVTESDFSFDHFNFELVTNWMGWLRKTRKNDPVTCNIRLGQLLAFFKWLSKKQLQYKSIYMDLCNVERLAVENRDERVEPISEKGIAVLVSTPGMDTLTGLKYTTLISFHYGTGTRTDEVFSIKVGELNLDCPRPNVMVTGKRRKVRVVNIPRKLVKLIKKYILVFHGQKYDANAYLFYSPSKGIHNKLSESGYNKQLDIYSHRANLISSECPKHVHPHQLRHSWATHALDHGVSIFQVSKALGHDSVDTTMRYLGVTMKMKMDAIMKTESFVAQNTKVNWRKNRSLEDLFR